jgi:hypothetical protein
MPHGPGEDIGTRQRKRDVRVDQVERLEALELETLPPVDRADVSLRRRAGGGAARHRRPLIRATACAILIMEQF